MAGRRRQGEAGTRRAARPALQELCHPLRVLPEVAGQVAGPNPIQQEGLDPSLDELPAGLLRQMVDHVVF